MMELKIQIFLTFLSLTFWVNGISKIEPPSSEWGILYAGISLITLILFNVVVWSW